MPRPARTLAYSLGYEQITSYPPHDKGFVEKDSFTLGDVANNILRVCYVLPEYELYTCVYIYTYIYNMCVWVCARCVCYMVVTNRKHLDKYTNTQLHIQPN